jgi:hypothetical protein
MEIGVYEFNSLKKKFVVLNYLFFTFWGKFCISAFGNAFSKDFRVRCLHMSELACENDYFKLLLCKMMGGYLPLFKLRGIWSPSVWNPAPNIWLFMCLLSYRFRTLALSQIVNGIKSDSNQHQRPGGRLAVSSERHTNIYQVVPRTEWHMFNIPAVHELVLIWTEEMLRQFVLGTICPGTFSVFPGFQLL